MAARKLKLHQLLALLKTVKPTTYKKLTQIHRDIQKKDLLNGFDKTFAKASEDDLDRAAERNPVVLNSKSLLAEWVNVSTKLFDMTATQETANAQAKADIVVNGQVLLANVPVTLLMFLDKQLVDLENTLENAVVLDPAMDWVYNANSNLYQASPVDTVATKKVPRSHVLYDATDKHPAQVQAYNEDKKAGVWTKVDRSGALPGDYQRAKLAMVRELILAVRAAREEANSIEVTDVKIGDTIFTHLFGDTLTSR